MARTVGFQPLERNIFFHILTACNLSCRHCYINTREHGSLTLPFETVVKWLRLFARQGKRSNLVLLGGEPTLHPDLAEIVRYAKSLRFSVTVDSNGYLFNDFLDKISPEELDFLSFSLDGPDAETNDPIRGDLSFETCIKNLQLAIKKGFQTSVIFTVSRLNIDQLHKMVDLLSTLGVKRFFIQVIGLRGKPAEKKSGSIDNWQVARQKWLEVIPKVAAEAAARGLHVTFPKVFLDENEDFSCAGLVAENYFIFPNGRVYRCPLCEDYPVHSMALVNDELVKMGGLTEDRFFQLNIPEGCVMNKLLQPDTIEYRKDGTPGFRISCCLIKQEMVPK